MSYAIRTLGGEHLGFLLMAGGPGSGNCIFRSLPFESENFDIAESEYLFALQQQGEFQWREADAVCRISDHQGNPIASIRDSRLTSSEFCYAVERLGQDA